MNASTQLVDISHRLALIQARIAQLQARGQYAHPGQLSLNATCGNQPSSRLFLAWGDSALYALPGQDAGNWSVHNVTTGSDENPYAADQNSLSFSDGNAQATTPTMCVNLDNPTIRLFAKDNGGNGQSEMKANVI